MNVKEKFVTNPLSAVLRIDQITTEKAELELALGSQVERFQLRRDGSSFFAQLNIPIARSAWDDVSNFVQKFGARILALQTDRRIGSAVIDMAFPIDDRMATASIGLASHVAAIIGKFGIDLEFSIYSTSNDGEGSSSDGDDVD